MLWRPTDTELLQYKYQTDSQIYLKNTNVCIMEFMEFHHIHSMSNIEGKIKDFLKHNQSTERNFLLKSSEKGKSRVQESESLNVLNLNVKKSTQIKKESERKLR